MEAITIRCLETTVSKTGLSNLTKAYMIIFQPEL